MAEYNGWTNYETWCVNLWIDQDEAEQEQLLDIIRGNADKYHAAEALKDYITDAMPEAPGMFTDLLTASVGRVNWQEIIENHWDDVEHGEATDEEEDTEEIIEPIIPETPSTVKEDYYSKEAADKINIKSHYIISRQRKQRPQKGA